MHQRQNLLRTTIGLAALPLALAGHAQGGMTFLTGTALPNSGGEIVSFYSASSSILSTFSSGTNHGVRVTSLLADGTLSSPAVPTIDLSGVFGPTGVYSVTSVQADRLGRDFGIATVIPNARQVNLGAAVFFQISTGMVLGQIPVGWHPDSVTMTPDGNRVVVANEGEYGSENRAVPEPFNRPGSVTVIDLTGITGTAELGNRLNGIGAPIPTITTDFSGVDLTGIRVNRADTPANAYLDIEPEYVVATNSTAYVTLQENNAFAVVDLLTGAITRVHGLGTLTQIVDNSDRDGATNQTGGATGNPRPFAAVDDIATGLPMPDTIVHFRRGDTNYVITANEGDARPDGNDEVRVGRLVTSNIEGTNPMFGTRSVSIWNADTGALVWDSSDGQGTSAPFQSFEDYILANDLQTFNMSHNDSFSWRPIPTNNFVTGLFIGEGGSDTRSDNKGPEPEAVAYGTIDGREFLFAAMERQGGIFMFDITDLGNIFLVDYVNLTQRASNVGQLYLSPESLQFVPASMNAVGQNLLLVGYENPQSSSGAVAVFTVIPEPSAYALLAGIAGVGLAALRRRRN